MTNRANRPRATSNKPEPRPPQAKIRPEARPKAVLSKERLFLVRHPETGTVPEVVIKFPLLFYPMGKSGPQATVQPEMSKPDSPGQPGSSDELRTITRRSSPDFPAARRPCCPRLGHLGLCVAKATAALRRTGCSVASNSRTIFVRRGAREFQFDANFRLEIGLFIPYAPQSQ